MADNFEISEEEANALTADNSMTNESDNGNNDADDKTNGSKTGTSYVSLEGADDSSAMMEEVSDITPSLTAPGGLDEEAYSVELGMEDVVADLQVVVKNPRKMNADALISSYVAYEVLTKTSRPNYGGAELNVLRRYSDFLWLREQLSYEFPTRLLPPLPPKSDLSRVAVDKFKDDFLQSRCAALQRFMTRLVDHPIINVSQCLRCFLVTKAKEFAIAKKEYERSLMSRMNESVSRIASKIMQRATDPQMQQLTEQVDTFSELMTQLEGACDTTQNTYYELTHNYRDMAATMRGFAEGNDDLQDSLMDLQNIMEQQAEGYKKLLLNTPGKLTEPMRDYRRYAESLKTTIDRQKALQVDAEVLGDMLTSEKKKLGDIVRPESNVSHDSQSLSQKKQSTESQIATLASQVEQANNSVEIAKSNLVADLDRWRDQQILDFREMFSSHADANVEFLTSSLDSWENLIHQLQDD